MTLKFTGERCVPWDERMHEWSWVLQHHLHRYTWALGAVAGKEVVDLGCGTGYGSFILSFLAKSVIGIDISRDAVEFANSNFRADNLKFGLGDLTNVSIPHAQIYTCFEVLEHIEDPYLIIRNLPIGSTLIWSIPVDDPGQFHRKVYSVLDILNTMQPSDFFYQKSDGMIIPEPGRFSEHFVEPKYILGVKQL